MFVAHTGLDATAGPGDVWLALPEDNVLELTWRRIGADVLPPDDDGKEAMLLSAWDAIDAWIDETWSNQPAGRCLGTPCDLFASFLKILSDTPMPEY